MTLVRRRSSRCGTATCTPSLAMTIVQVLRLLARRHHQLIAGRTRAICRLHAVLLVTMVAGGLPRRSSRRNGPQPSSARSDPPMRSVDERKHIAVEFLDEVRRDDRALGELDATCRRSRSRPRTATSPTVYGVGPIVACYLLGYSGDVRRFPTAGHYARYNATAPIEASSGPRVRHRLNPNGNRQLNHAIHIAASVRSATTPTGTRLLPTQTSPRARHQRSVPSFEATDQRRRLPTTPRRPHPLNETGPGRQSGATLKSSAAGRSLNTGTSERSFPDPDHNARTDNPSCHGHHPTRANTANNKPLDTNRLRSGKLLARVRGGDMCAPERLRASHAPIGDPDSR